MEIEIVLNPDGTFQVSTNTGTFRKGKEEIEKLIFQLLTYGVPMETIGRIEQHTHEKPAKVEQKISS